MKPLIKLYKENWSFSKGVYLIGWAEWSGKVYEGTNFLDLIYKLTNNRELTIDEIARIANQLNGTFAIIIEREDEIILLSDHIRSYPLVYTFQENTMIVTDHLLRCSEDLQLNLQPNIDNCEFYLTSGHVLGSDTVFSNCFAVQAAEVVFLTENGVNKKRYFVYQLDMSEESQLDLVEEVSKQNIIYQKAFERMLATAPDIHNWIVPLSGGHDSRMVLYRLYKAGVKNVICYTYGYPGNEQARISYQLAKTLGYSWFFVEYTPEKWKKLRMSRDFNAYSDFAFNGISDPHLQDLLAVYELKNEQILQPGDIFVPGHTFDFLTGAYCWNKLDTISTFDELFSYLRKYIDQWPCRKRTRSVYKQLYRCWQESCLPFDQFTEYFFWQERHAKFIQNSLRVYEYFGFDWRTPLWDRTIVDYWQGIPLKYKLYRNFLYSCEKNGLYGEEINTIAFDMEMTPVSGWKRKIQNFLPEFFLRNLRFLLKKENPQIDPLTTIYHSGNLLIKDLVDYDHLPEALKYYLMPYKGRPVFLNPDNDVNSLYSLRNIFTLKR